MVSRRGHDFKYALNTDIKAFFIVYLDYGHIIWYNVDTFGIAISHGIHGHRLDE
jgi:hypothetical protein